MKTTRGRYDFTGTTHRIDESGRKLYTIWSDGVVWVYPGFQEQHTLELDQIGCLRRWSVDRKDWDEVEGASEL